MTKAAAKPDPLAVRRLHIERLLRHQQKIADDILVIDEEKEWLRAECEKSGSGFTEEIAGLGAVEVKLGSEPEFKGSMPKLVAENFLELPQKEQKTWVDRGVVVIEKLWSRGSKPSVTVRM